LLRIFGKTAFAIIAALTLLTVAPAIWLVPTGTVVSSEYTVPLHAVMEAFSVIMSALVFAMGWQTYGEDRSGAITILCCIFLGVGALDLMHLLSYPSLPNFITANSYQKALLLSLSGNSLMAAALLAAAMAPNCRGNSNFVRWTILLVTVVSTAAIAWLCIFFAPRLPSLLAGPAQFNAIERGVHALHTLMLCPAAALFVQRYRRESLQWVRHLAAGSLVLAVSTTSFALRQVPNDWFNIIGHLDKIVAGYFVYRAIFLRSVQLPIDKLNTSETSLRKSQQELALTKIAVDRSSDYIYMIAADTGRILYANEVACARMGHSREQMLALTASDIGPGTNPTDVSMLTSLGGSASHRFECLHNTRDGEVFPVEVTATFIREAEQAFYYCSVRDITERKRIERAHRETAQHLRRVIDSMPYFVSLLTPEGNFLETNRKVLDVWGLGEDEVRGVHLNDLMSRMFSADICSLLGESIQRAAAGETVHFDLKVPINGTPEYSSFYIAPVFGDDDQVRHLIATSVSITDRVHAQEQLRLAAIVFDYSAEAILITDGNMRILSVNRAFTTLTGFPESEIVGTVPPLFENGRHLSDLRNALQDTGNWSGEVEWLCRDGRLCFEWLTATKVHDIDGSVSNYIVIFSDISEKKRTEEHIQYLAYYDPLTSLPNRVLLEDRVKLALAAARRAQHKVAVIFLDLDHFKTINDSLGHHCGDRILAEMGKRLKRTVREVDTVARLGGDEFVVLLTALQDSAQAAAICKKLLAELALPYLTGGAELRLTVSAGISVFPEDGADFSRLIMNADAAMYHAKAMGRNNTQFFIDEMNRRAAGLLSMENRLRGAIEHGELILHYQPQLDLWSGAIIGVEALVRWRDPERGLIPPSEFIPVAEERGLIGEIGAWVLREACRQNQSWQRAGLPRLPIAVNISASQFRQDNLMELVRGTLRDTGLEPRYLELEVTESAVMHDAERLISTLEELRSLGVFLAVDDFGTGYSSLSYLKRFPIDKIKIDRSFVCDIPGDKDDYSIVRAIIGLGKQLGLKVVAEGVETQVQLDALRESNCDHYQGFFFSRPVDADALEELLRVHSISPA